MIKRITLVALFALAIIGLAKGLPVKQAPPAEEEKKSETEHHEDSPTQNLENIIEYERYLKEVVSALESDKEFRKKLDSASEVDIRVKFSTFYLNVIIHFHPFNSSLERSRKS